MDRIVVVNRSTVLTDAEVAAVVPALQAQVREDFAPIWGIDAEVVFAADPAPASAGVGWHIAVLDTTDVAGAGGYHVDANGRVSGKVFAKDAIAAGEAWTVDASHELLEMLADPSAGTDPAQFVDLTGRYAGLQCLKEVCDAVEDDSLGYTIDRVLVSDFVTPAYFTGAAAAHYDFCGQLAAPAPALLTGGYLGIYDPQTRAWSQVSDFALASRSQRSMRRALSRR